MTRKGRVNGLQGKKISRVPAQGLVAVKKSRRNLVKD